MAKLKVDLCFCLFWVGILCSSSIQIIIIDLGFLFLKNSIVV